MNTFASHVTVYIESKEKNMLISLSNIRESQGLGNCIIKNMKQTRKKKHCRDTAWQPNGIAMQAFHTGVAVRVLVALFAICFTAHSPREAVDDYASPQGPDTYLGNPNGIP